MRLSSRTAAVAEGVGDEERKILLPGGGPMARLPRLIGSGRPLETLPSDNNLDGALAERCRSIDRSLPDGDLGEVRGNSSRNADLECFENSAALRRRDRGVHVDRANGRSSLKPHTEEIASESAYAHEC